MQVADWGILDDPLVVFGGPYSNRHALDALIKEARGTTLLCTGDVVAYCAEPAQTIARLRSAGAYVIAGNCEKQLAAGAMDCGCGFDEGSACDLLSAGWFAFADRHVGAEAREWMAGLPDIVVFRHAGARYGVIHGGVRDVAQFLWSVSPKHELEAEWQALEALTGPINHVISGHSGIAFMRDIQAGRWINAGVIGMPPNRGTPETEFVRLAEGRAEICSLHYDAVGAQSAMIAAGLTQGYHTALTSGYWPSEDVLPDALRRSASVASG